MPTERGHRKRLEQLEADGIDTICGNPGSAEEANTHTTITMIGERAADFIKAEGRPGHQ